MSLALAARLARRELRGGLKGFRIFLACLTLGVAAIAAIGLVRDNIRDGLAEQGAALLGGDAAVSFTYRFADPDERTYLEGISTELSEIADFRSMAVVGEVRGLTQVKAVDDAYPLVGAVQLDPAIGLAQALDGADGLPGAVMEPLLAERLGIGPGDSFTLGTQRFHLSALLISEPDDATAGIGLGPRSILRRADLAGSGLLRPGTLFDGIYRLRLPPGSDLAALEAQTRAALEGAGLRWRDSRNGAPGMRHAVERLSAFLVLIGLAGLAVGGVGVSAAVRAYLDEKTETIAVLKTLGAEARLIFQIYLLEIGALTLFGLVLGLALGAALPLLFAPLIEAALPLQVEMSLRLAPLGQAGLYGALAALLFSIWPLARAEEVRAAALFRDAALGSRHWPRPRYVILTALLLAGLIGSAALFTGMVKITLWTGFAITLAFLALLLAGFLLRLVAGWLARRAMLRSRPGLRMALAAVGGPGGETGTVVLSLGLGLSVLATVGQIDNNLRGAIERELPGIAPSFFVVDIQPDQIDAVKQRLESDPGVSRIDAAPMLRGVITRINGRPAEEVGGDHWVLRGDRGLTYSAELPARTRVVAGTWWPADYSGPPQISFAAKEAGEIGLSLGDSLTMNILGREITGTITSLREVDFSSAGMGFVLSMNPAALAGAPHSFIATIYAERAAEPAILRDLSDSFPNITVISVRSVIARVTGLMGSIAAGITYGALATLITGFVVIIGAAAAGERSRSYEAALLKTLGATRATVLFNFALRSVLLGGAAGLVAVGAGAGFGWAVTHFVMENDFAFEPVSAIAIVSFGITVTLLAGLAFAWRPLAARPAQVLRARE